MGGQVVNEENHQTHRLHAHREDDTDAQGRLRRRRDDLFPEIPQQQHEYLPTKSPLAVRVHLKIIKKFVFTQFNQFPESQIARTVLLYIHTLYNKTSHRLAPEVIV